MFNSFISVATIWLGLFLVLLFSLSACTYRPTPTAPIADKARLTALQEKTTAAVYLRAEAFRRVDQYHRLGGLVAKFNPNLTTAEQYEIGRAILDYSEERGLDPLLVVAVIKVESEGRLYATSKAGALGLMQVMPHMAAKGEDLFIIDKNISRGTFILADNIKRWGPVEGVARYYWGSKKRPDGRYYAKVQKALEGLRG